MGLNESVIKSLTGPCERCTHECNKYTMDDMEFDSNCSKCCTLHLKTNPHKMSDSDEEYESIASENAEHD